MNVTPDDLLPVLSRTPQSVGDLGVAIAATQGYDPAAVAGHPVGQWLAAAGLSLSALQKLVDQLVREGLVVEVKGRELWDLDLPTEGTKAMGRYYLLPV